MLERANYALSILKNMDMKNKIYLIPSIIATLLLILFIALKPVKAKAEVYSNVEAVEIPQVSMYDYPTYTFLDFGGNNNLYMVNINGFGSCIIFETLLDNISGYMNLELNWLVSIYICDKTAQEIDAINDEDLQLQYVTSQTEIMVTCLVRPENSTHLLLAVAPIEPKNYSGSLVVRFNNGLLVDVYDNFDYTQPYIAMTSNKTSYTVGINEDQQEANNRYYYDFGYDNGYDDGIDAGYDMGYEDAETTLGNSNSAYQLGKEAGIKSNSVRIGQTITGIFSGLTDFLNIQVFNGITLGGLMLIPLMFGILWVVLKIIRG